MNNRRSTNSMVAFLKYWRLHRPLPQLVRRTSACQELIIEDNYGLFKVSSVNMTLKNSMALETLLLQCLYFRLPHRLPTNSKFDAWGFTWAKFVVTIQLETTFIRKKRLNIIKQSCILFSPKWPPMSFLALWKLFPGHFHVWESASKWLFNVLVNLSVRSSSCFTHKI